MLPSGYEGEPDSRVAQIIQRLSDFDRLYLNTQMDRSRDSVEEREKELLRELVQLVPDLSARVGLVAMTFTDPGGQALYRHLFVVNPPGEDESVQCHLRRTLGVEKEAEFYKGTGQVAAGDETPFQDPTFRNLLRCLAKHFMSLI